MKRVIRTNQKLRIDEIPEKFIIEKVFSTTVFTDNKGNRISHTIDIFKKTEVDFSAIVKEVSNSFIPEFVEFKLLGINKFSLKKVPKIRIKLNKNIKFL